MAETCCFFGTQKICSLILYTVLFKEMIDAVMRLSEIANLADTMKVLTTGLVPNSAAAWCAYWFIFPLLRIHGSSTRVPRLTGWELLA
jgi:hypothetical protein